MMNRCNMKVFITPLFRCILERLPGGQSAASNGNPRHTLVRTEPPGLRSGAYCEFNKWGTDPKTGCTAPLSPGATSQVGPSRMQAAATLLRVESDSR